MDLMDFDHGIVNTGFPLMARRLAISQDYDAFIFRKFDRLSARNLLYQESRLACLEQRLEQADAQAAAQAKEELASLPRGEGSETLRSIRAYETFEKNSKDTMRTEHVRKALCDDIERTLKDYRMGSPRDDRSGPG